MTVTNQGADCVTSILKNIAGDRGLGFLLDEPADIYHAKAAEYLSSHQLADFRRCPLLYQKKRLGLITDEDRPAYLVGRALHCLALEGRDRYEADFAVGGPINPATGALYGANTKAYAEWAARQGRPVLTPAQAELVENMAQSVRAHAAVAELLRDGIAEGVVRAVYCDTPCQIRMDWFDPHQGIVDLKTCDDLTWFEADARRYGYVHQMAFYRAVLATVLAVAMPVWLVAVEKKEPYRTGLWRVAAEALAQAQRENEAAIERLKRCEQTETWGTGYEECRVFDQV